MEEESQKIPIKPASEELPACGPGCNCGAPAGSTRVKTVGSLIALTAVISIVLYKATACGSGCSCAAPSGSATSASQGDTAFTPQAVKTWKSLVSLNII